MSQKKREVPHTYVIVFAFIFMAIVATWFVPGGHYTYSKQMVNGLEQTTATYEPTENIPQTWQIFSSIFDGFVKQAGIIVFILMIGGAFWIVNYSKALDVGIFAFVRYSSRLERFKWLNTIGVNNIIMVFIMLMFSVFGAVFGMSEETIAFIIIFVPLAVSMGYDSIVGVNLCFVAAALGFAGAFLNPFTIGIAQGLSGLPLFSGIEYRLFCWVVITFVGITYILIYAARIKKNPQRSSMYQLDEHWRSSALHNTDTIKYYTPKAGYVMYVMIVAVLVLFSVKYPQSTLSIEQSQLQIPILPILTVLFGLLGFLSLRKSVHYFILILLTFTILFLIIGVMGYQWYIKEIAALFFALGLSTGIALNISANHITKLFIEGAKDIFSAAFVVGLAGGIIIILQNGQIVDSIMHSLSNAMVGFNKLGSVSIMYGIQTAINIIIPSGSAKAALTMPIMAPFSDLIGLSRQAAVMAYQFGDGFTNIITPSSGVLIGVLGVAKIPFGVWFKWVLPLVIVLTIIGFLLLIPTVTMNLNGF